MLFLNFDAPGWINDDKPRPVEYDFLVRQGLIGCWVPPWVVLPLDEVAATTVKLQHILPHRKLVAFAERSDSGEVACWDAECTNRKVLIVPTAPSMNQPHRVLTSGSVDTYLGLWDWLRHAVDLMVELHHTAAARAHESQDAEFSTTSSRNSEAPWQRKRPEMKFFSIAREPEWMLQSAPGRFYEVLDGHFVTEANWCPWRFVRGPNVTAGTVTVGQLYHDRRFVVFAHRADDVVACWDAARSDGVIYMVHNWYSPEPERYVVTYPDMLQWFRSVVVEDYIAVGEKWVEDQKNNFS